MKKMKIFAKFWQNILTHVVNISLKIWKFEGESLQNIEFDQQKHYSFSLLTRSINKKDSILVYFVFDGSQWKQKAGEDFRKHLFLNAALMMHVTNAACSHIFSAGPVTVCPPRPQCHQLTHSPGSTLYTFCCKPLATRQEGPQ